jgi:hypothetical protein|tara:strand:+ start:3146 stop:3559 length:414 start_codon:yes stop_codon:yes gene_type:complete
MKKRLTKIVQELEEDLAENLYEKKPFNEVLEICKEKLDSSCFSGTGKNTWVLEDCQDAIKEALRLPEIAPKTYAAHVVRLAPNPSYVYVYIKELSTTKPAVVPRKMQSSLKGKNIKVQCIKDENGETFRYERPKIYS